MASETALIVFYDVEVTLTDGTSWQTKATEVQPIDDLLHVFGQHGPLAAKELIESFPLALVDHWTVTPQRWPSGEVIAA